MWIKEREQRLRGISEHWAMAIQVIMKASHEDKAAKVVCCMETSALMKGHMEVGSFGMFSMNTRKN